MKNSPASPCRTATSASRGVITLKNWRWPTDCRRRRSPATAPAVRTSCDRDDDQDFDAARAETIAALDPSPLTLEEALTRLRAAVARCEPGFGPTCVARRRSLPPPFRPSQVPVSPMGLFWQRVAILLAITSQIHHGHKKRRPCVHTGPSGQACSPWRGMAEEYRAPTSPWAAGTYGSTSSHWSNACSLPIKNVAAALMPTSPEPLSISFCFHIGT